MKTSEKKNNEWYNLRPILGYANWSMFYILCGGREAGKSYSVTSYFVHQFVTRGIPFIWIRLTDTQVNKLLKNNAEKLIDPDIRRKYKLNLDTLGNNVYCIKGKKKILMARVYAASTFYNDKGSIYDKDFLKDPNMKYNIAVDEFQREEGEKNTFDVIYCLANQLENLVRSTKERISIFFLGNCLEDSADVLSAFNFIPEKWGIFKLKSRRCVIQNIEPTEQYKKRRLGTVASYLCPDASTFTNTRNIDDSLVDFDHKLHKPSYVIKFTKNRDTWFTVWDGNYINKYKGEKKPVKAMRPYLDELFNSDVQKSVIELFDTRSLKFKNTITFIQFQKQMMLLKPRE